MRSKLLYDGPQRTYALVFDTGDEPVADLERFAAEQNLTATQLTGLGAFQEAVVGYYDWIKKDYRRIPIKEQVEVISLVGDIVLADGKPKLHAHVVLGREDGSTRGGHLLEARVRPTLEVILTESPAHLKREKDAETGLPLIRIGG